HLAAAPSAQTTTAAALSARIDDDALEVHLALPARREHARLELFDILGNRVALLRTGTLDAGERTLRFSMNDLSSGNYFVRLTSERGESLSTGVVRSR